MPDDFDRLVDFLGRDHPSIEGILWAAQHNSKMRGAAYHALRRRCKQETGVNPDNLPRFPLVRELPAGDIALGHVLNGEVPGPVFALPTSDFCGHVGLFGAAGAGKSWCAKHLISQHIRAGGRVWLLDSENEHADLLDEFPTDVLVPATPDILRLSLFEPPHDSIEPKVWLAEIGLLLRGLTFIRDGAENLHDSAILKLLEQKGVLAGSRAYPTIEEALEHFRGLGFGPKTRSLQWTESLVNRYATLNNALGLTFAASSSDVLRFLASRSVIFRLDTLSGVPLQFVSGYLLKWLSTYKAAAMDSFFHMVVIEEFHRLMTDPRRMDIGKALLPDLFRRARKRWLLFVLLDQVPGLLPPAVLANLGVSMALRLSDPRSLWAMGESMSLAPEQAAMLPELQKREAIVRYSAYPHPFLARIGDLTFGPKPPEAEIRRRAQEALAGVRWLPRVATAMGLPSGQVASQIPAPSDPVTGDALKVMISICEHSELLIDERCDALQMDRSREGRARQSLLDLGLIAKSSQAMGKNCFYEITPKGEDWSRHHGAQIRVKRYKSGPAHEAILMKVQHALGKALPGCRFQLHSTIGAAQGKQPDLTITLRNGLLVVVEVCCNNPQYEVGSLIKESEIPGVDLVLAIASGAQVQHKIQRELDAAVAKRGPQLIPRASVVVLNGTEAIEPTFDWIAALSRP